MDLAYRYKALVDRVIDGDTLKVSVDLGFRVWLKGIKIRLLGVNCPELTSTNEAGLRAKKFTEEFVYGDDAHLPVEVVIETVKVDKYGGRWDAKVWVGDKCLNEALVESGNAVRVA